MTTSLLAASCGRIDYNAVARFDGATTIDGTAGLDSGQRDGDSRDSSEEDGATIESDGGLPVLEHSLALGVRRVTHLRRSQGRVDDVLGNDGSGQLGDGGSTTAMSRTPVTVSGLTDGVEVFGGNNHTCARRASGGVACWGSDLDGALRNGALGSSDVPTPVVGITDAVQLSVGTAHACIVRSTGEVMCSRTPPARSATARPSRNAPHLAASAISSTRSSSAWAPATRARGARSGSSRAGASTTWASSATVHE